MGIRGIVKLALISVVVLFVILTAFSMLLPSAVVITRTADINASPDSALMLIADLSNWHKWLDVDDANQVKLVHSNSDTHLLIQNTRVSIEYVTDSLVQTKWQVGDGRAMQGEFRVSQASSSSMVTLQWAFIIKVKWYPWEKFSSIVSEKALGSFLDKNLKTLEAYLESQH